jgi:hypothetical protein
MERRRKYVCKSIGRESRSQDKIEEETGNA